MAAVRTMASQLRTFPMPPSPVELEVERSQVVALVIANNYYTSGRNLCVVTHQ
eukprot:CAMPEP_0185544802 /NCGR_PEP_ID=MMETSP1381-20130426/4327_1 /TAXON_ID=298111 /ORGANISM="Pavlova sp., Strain CCMP459" /LENGTH=52 /DNA_ID=CAMNT_0028157065 /DNA_START=37 /DNA_END=195 /DNA_ORIENTATION=-